MVRYIDYRTELIKTYTLETMPIETLFDNMEMKYLKSSLPNRVHQEVYKLWHRSCSLNIIYKGIMDDQESQKSLQKWEEDEEDVGNTRNSKWKVAAPRSTRHVHPRSTLKSESRVEMASNLARKMMMDTPRTWRNQRCRNGTQPEHGRISAAKMDKNRNEKH